MEPRTHNELRRKKLAPTSGFLVLVCHAQVFAKHLSCPIRYRLCGLTQLAADELGHYAEAAAMRLLSYASNSSVCLGTSEICSLTPDMSQSRWTRARLVRLDSCAPTPGPHSNLSLL